MYAILQTKFALRTEYIIEIWSLDGRFSDVHWSLNLIESFLGICIQKRRPDLMFEVFFMRFELEGKMSLNHKLQNFKRFISKSYLHLGSKFVT
jgi:hypothetical protein